MCAIWVVSIRTVFGAKGFRVSPFHYQFRRSDQAAVAKRSREMFETRIRHPRRSASIKAASSLRATWKSGRLSTANCSTSHGRGNRPTMPSSCVGELINWITSPSLLAFNDRIRAQWTCPENVESTN